MRLVRSRAVQWGIDPDRIGTLSFSADGEVAELIAYASGKGDPAAPDPIDRVDGKPDFQLLVYPGPLGVPGTIPADAPPAFIIAGSLDECCAQPAIALYEQLRKGQRSAELHMYAGSGHAFNLDESNRISIVHWPDRLADWLADEGFLSSR